MEIKNSNQLLNGYGLCINPYWDTVNTVIKNYDISFHKDITQNSQGTILNGEEIKYYTDENTNEIH